jgi:methylated-DNA-[protein]-cysteine S-methyltransferase
MAYALQSTSLQTPLGSVIIEGDSRTVNAVRIVGDAVDIVVSPAPEDSPVMAAAMQLREYFDGTRRYFTIPLAPLVSARGMALRQGLVQIPFGSTTTYGALAKQLASGPRAVGQACRRNPMPIIVPCHRVTSSSGPEHYSGGAGPVTKAWLIDFEAEMSGQRSRLL